MSTIPPLTNKEAPEGTIDLLALLAQVLENKLLIILITSISLGCGIFYLSRQIPEFQSSVLMQVDANGSKNIFKNNLISPVPWVFNKGNDGNLQIALMKSRVILGPVSQTLGLDIAVHHKQNFFKRLFSLSHINTKITTLDLPTKYINKPLDLVYDQINHVSVYDENHKLLIAGNIRTALQNNHKQIKLIIHSIHAPIGTHFTLIKRSTENLVNELAGRLKIADIGGERQPVGVLEITLKDSNPEQAVRILNQIAKTTQTRDIHQKSLEASKTLEFLYQQLPITKQSLENAESKLNQYRSSSGKIDFKFQTAALLQQLVAIDRQLSELRTNQANMQHQYTPAHPSAIALTQQINAIEAQRTNLEKTLKRLPASDQIAVNLSRDISVKTILYTTLLSKIQELKVIQAGTVSDISILSYAKLPDSPVPARKQPIYLGSIFLGLLLSTLIIFGRKILFPKIEDPHWCEQQFEIPNLAIVPYSKEQHENTKNLAGSHHKQYVLLAQANPRNRSIEALRNLRTSLQVNLSCSSNNIISILGITPGVGKTFVSVNIAYLLATAGKRVILIDADLRRGSAHHYFNVSATPGFAELIDDKKTIGEVLKQTSHKNLHILPRGSYPTDPSELLASEQCKNLFKEFSKQYDVVIIDTSPILVVTDAALIGAHSTTNYLVLGSNVHTTTEVEIAIKRLLGAGVTINGSIFNFHNAQSIHNPYYYRYYSYNYYYDDAATNSHSKVTI